ncbi:MAG: FecR domain-containing protein [Bacteroidetes bacterium]|nr:FecR domain-containing protein [Bacteroidota bacterium]
MKDYNEYTVSEFVLDDSFRRWVLKNSPSESSFWEKWQLDHPNQHENISKAREFVLKMHRSHELLSDDELKEALNQLSEARNRENVFVKPLLNRISWWKQAVAAMVVLGLVGAIYAIYQTNVNPPVAYEVRKSQLGTQLVEIINDDKTEKWVSLPDGSKVRLSPLSRLSYPKAFASAAREVYLSGEGFFEVTKNPQKPFLVYANELVTKVLGTSFWVRAFDKAEKVEVIVKTGRVSVYSAEEQAEKAPSTQLTGTILTPNQQVIFDRKDENIEKSLVSTPAPLVEVAPQKSSGLTFNSAPVGQAFEALSQAYGIEILYDKDVVKNCEISAEFVNESFYEQLDLICKAIDATYQIVNAQIIIQGKGCTPN